MKKYCLLTLLFIPIYVHAVTYMSTNNLALGDFVYLDPINNLPCSQENYWTYFNQDTTCYRWNVLSATSATSKLFLDHNIAKSTFNNYQAKLNEATSDWSRVTNIDLIDENTIKTIKKLSSTPTTSTPSVGGGTPFWMSVNNLFYDNRNYTTLESGYWSKTSYNDTHAYFISSTGVNSLSLKTDGRGIRPIITVDNNKLTGSYKEETIYPTLKYKFAHLTETFNDKTYVNLQGFTFTNNKLVYASNNGSDATKANTLLFWQSGTNYATRNYKMMNNMGHANDMTYNSKTNKIVVAGLFGGTAGDQIWLFDNNSISTAPQKVDSKRSGGYTGIAYDKYNDLYFAKSGCRGFILSNDFDKVYTFDVPFLEVSQGMDYHNGYVYIPVTELGDSSHDNSGSQLYYRGSSYFLSNRVYVYNAKLKKDGKPDKDFGKLVKIYYIPQKNTSSVGYGEIETVSFLNNVMYLGYGASYFDSTYTYKFYNYNEPVYNMKYNIISYVVGDIKTINIISHDEISCDNNLTDWNINNDSHIISKSININENVGTPTICDLYTNCTQVDYNNEITFEGAIIDFEKNIFKSSAYNTLYNLKENTSTSSAISVIDKNNNTITDSDYIKTADKICINKNSSLLCYDISILGDFNSDGEVDNIDAKNIAKYITMKNKNLTNAKFAAGDINRDNKVKMNDVMMLLNGEIFEYIEREDLEIQHG